MWFTENPWPPIIVLAALGVMFGMAGISRQQFKLYAISALCFVLCVVVWVVERQVVTEGEKIEQQIYDLTEAFQQNNLERTLSFFSNSNPLLKGKVGIALGLADIQDDYRITDYEVSLKADDTLATTHFRVNATTNVVGHGDVGRQPTRWLVEWRLEAGEWKITDVTRLKLIGPVTDTMPLFQGSR